jgi:hypothetical protein
MAAHEVADPVVEGIAWDLDPLLDGAGEGAEGVQRWRESVIESVHMPAPNRFFPGSNASTLYVIHPEVVR